MCSPLRRPRLALTECRLRCRQTITYILIQSRKPSLTTTLSPTPYARNCRKDQKRSILLPHPDWDYRTRCKGTIPLCRWKRSQAIDGSWETGIRPFTGQSTRQMGLLTPCGGWRVRPSTPLCGRFLSMISLFFRLSANEPCGIWAR
jgi:hypothetical protein